MFKEGCQKSIVIIIKHANLLFKLQKIYRQYWSKKKVVMANKVVRQSKNCFICVTEKLKI